VSSEKLKASKKNRIRLDKQHVEAKALWSVRQPDYRYLSLKINKLQITIICQCPPSELQFQKQKI